MSVRNLALEQILKEAINSLSIVAIVDAGGGRVAHFAPHALYWSADNEVVVLGCVMAKRGEELGTSHLQVFEVSAIKKVKITDDEFLPLRGFNSRRQQFAGGVLAAVDR